MKYPYTWICINIASVVICDTNIVVIRVGEQTVLSCCDIEHTVYDSYKYCIL